MILVPTALSGGPRNELLLPGVPLAGGVDHLRVLVNRSGPDPLTILLRLPRRGRLVRYLGLDAVTPECYA